MIVLCVLLGHKWRPRKIKRHYYDDYGNAAWRSEETGYMECRRFGCIESQKIESSDD